MANRCKGCSHPRAQALAVALRSRAASLPQIADAFEIHISSLRRHYRDHVVTVVLDPEVMGTEPGPTDLVTELVAILTDTRRVGTEAARAGRSDVVLRAARESRATIEILVSQLGITDAELAKDLEQSKSLAIALGALIREVPAVGLRLAEKLRERGDIENADDVQQYAENLATSIEGKTA